MSYEGYEDLRLSARKKMMRDIDRRITHSSLTVEQLRALAEAYAHLVKAEK